MLLLAQQLSMRCCCRPPKLGCLPPRPHLLSCPVRALAPARPRHPVPLPPGRARALAQHRPELHESRVLASTLLVQGYRLPCAVWRRVWPPTRRDRARQELRGLPSIPRFPGQAECWRVRSGDRVGEGSCLLRQLSALHHEQPGVLALHSLHRAQQGTPTRRTACARVLRCLRSVTALPCSSSHERLSQRLCQYAAHHGRSMCSMRCRRLRAGVTTWTGVCFVACALPRHVIHRLPQTQRAPSVRASSPPSKLHAGV